MGRRGGLGGQPAGGEGVAEGRAGGLPPESGSLRRGAAEALGAGGGLDVGSTGKRRGRGRKSGSDRAILSGVFHRRPNSVGRSGLYAGLWRGLIFTAAPRHRPAVKIIFNPTAPTYFRIHFHCRVLKNRQ